jgi:glycerol-3-phosphate dehydrogenase
VWDRGWRQTLWDELAGPRKSWDVIVVGGGIAGAGILREAARCGLRALLLEGRDFASGTSSRSSKLVHGGIRYLQHGHWKLTRESLRERDRLLREAPGLVEPLMFIRAIYQDENRWLYRGAFLAYGLLAGRRQHEYLRAADVLRTSPALAPRGLRGGYEYTEAGVDDARLVLRLLREAVRAGACALSYAPVESLLLAGGAVTGVRVRDAETGHALELAASVVVNAAGTSVDRLRVEVGGTAVIRPLRGSHLLFAAERLPLSQGLSFRHPKDGRNVFAAPWEGATLVGTTDVDHHAPLDLEPRISVEEVAYLLEAVTTCFPALALDATDVIATWAGVRPVIGHRGADPSSESRESMLVDERGLLSVTGGKLTTVRSTALAALARVRARCRDTPAPSRDARLFDEADGGGADHPALDPMARRRLRGRHGHDAAAVVAGARAGEMDTVPGTRTLWAEIRWAARAEGVIHLDDLLLRRSRLGVLLPAGGAQVLPGVRAMAQAELGWSDGRWQAEETAYFALWREAYRVPQAFSVREP